MLSFCPPNALVAAFRPQATPAGPVSFMHYDLDRDAPGDLFTWDKDVLLDFVVGPRMPWDLRQKSDYKSVY